MPTNREQLAPGLVLDYDTRTPGEVLERLRVAAQYEPTDERAPHEGAAPRTAPQSEKGKEDTARQTAGFQAEIHSHDSAEVADADVENGAHHNSYARPHENFDNAEAF
jgi:hypothetical protein